jgi:hypothetical protein
MTEMSKQAYRVSHSYACDNGRKPTYIHIWLKQCPLLYIGGQNASDVWVHIYKTYIMCYILYGIAKDDREGKVGP